MKVTKELLQALSIGAIYLYNSDNIYLCMPLEINKNEWIVAADSGNIPQNVTLKINYKNEYLYFKITLNPITDDQVYCFLYQIILEADNTDSRKMELLHFINEMELKNKIWDLRKERRYEIGIDEKKIKLMHFKSAEHSIFIDGFSLPCVINNLSYSGAKITTYESDFRVNKKICLSLSYREPIEVIPIMAEIKNCIIKQTSSYEVMATLSMEFIDSPLSYKNRLSQFIKNIENECINE